MELEIAAAREGGRVQGRELTVGIRRYVAVRNTDEAAWAAPTTLPSPCGFDRDLSVARAAG